MHLRGHDVTTVQGIKAVVHKGVTAFEDGLWQTRVAAYPSTSRVYQRLQVKLTPHLAQHLNGAVQRHRRLVGLARVSALPCLDAVQRRRDVPRVAFGARVPCPMCHQAIPEGVEHFLLECARWRPQRRRLWADLKGHASVTPAVAGVVTQAVAAHNRSLLLRVLLQGDCSEDMPDGYSLSVRQCTSDGAKAASAARRAVAVVCGRFLSDLERQRRRAGKPAAGGVRGAKPPGGVGGAAAAAGGRRRRRRARAGRRSGRRHRRR